VSALRGLLDTASLDPALAGQADLTGADPVFPSSFAIGQAAQASIAATALAAAAIHAARGGPMQRVGVDMRHAAIEFRSERHLRENGAEPPDPWDDIAGAYICGDGRVVRLHTNFPHHRAGMVRLLGGADTRAGVAAALAQREAFAFEEEATAAGLCVSAMRSFAEWDAHPHSAVLAAMPVVEVTRMGEAPPRAHLAREELEQRQRLLSLQRRRHAQRVSAPRRWWRAGGACPPRRARGGRTARRRP
jgi:crotonobetainyl-CoA:carnitine CoA-transferase CaiB-like acyl-CoA transferase